NVLYQTSVSELNLPHVLVIIPAVCQMFHGQTLKKCPLHNRKSRVHRTALIHNPLRKKIVLQDTYETSPQSNHIHVHRHVANNPTLLFSTFYCPLKNRVGELNVKMCSFLNKYEQHCQYLRESLVHIIRRVVPCLSPLNILILTNFSLSIFC